MAAYSAQTPCALEFFRTAKCDLFPATKDASQTCQSKKSLIYLKPRSFFANRKLAVVHVWIPLTGVAMWWRTNRILTCHRKAEGQGQSLSIPFVNTNKRPLAPHSFCEHETPVCSAKAKRVSVDCNKILGKMERDPVFFANVSRLNSNILTG